MTAGEPVRARDLLTWVDGATVYVVACDSNAAVGERPGDFLARPAETVGYSAAKVALMEVLATGASPFIVTNALCGPLDDYGRRIVAGIGQALAEIGSDAVVTGSDETNMRTSQTGVGVTVVGRADAAVFRLGGSRSGDVVACVGRPKDGVRVPYREGDADIAAPRDVVALLATPAHEILPVGSKGIGHEIAELAATAGLHAELVDSEIDPTASAGASTCVLVSVDEAALGEIRAAVSLPVQIVARLRAAGLS